MGKQWKQWKTLFSWAPKLLQIVTVAMKLKDTCSLEEKLFSTIDSVLKSRDITLQTKVHIIKAMVFPVVMYGCENWTKEWCFWTVRLEKTLESHLDCKEIKPVNIKGNQCWIFMGGTDAEDEALILWPCDAERWLIGKDPHTGKDWRQEEKGMTEGEMVGWHHWLSGQAPGLSKLQEMVKDREAWHAAVHGVSKSQIRLRDWTVMTTLIEHILASRHGTKHFLTRYLI